jgi:dTDP-4-dehydrorhamnose 3,5-epimerase
MKFIETRLPGAWIVELEKHGDERGFFARAYCRDEFAEHGLMTEIVQANLSLSRRAGTLRGMHLQVPPAAEIKLVRCVRGAIHDVIVDLRPRSPTFGEWLGVELSAANRTMLYVPEGFAHGFLTLTDDAETFYQVSAPYTPECERGIRYDDPRIGIEWPGQPVEISEKDRSWPDFRPLPELEEMGVTGAGGASPEPAGASSGAAGGNVR